MEVLAGRMDRAGPMPKWMESSALRSAASATAGMPDGPALRAIGHLRLRAFRLAPRFGAIAV